MSQFSGATSGTSSEILDEAIILEVQGWMAEKSAEELSAVLQEEDSSPSTYPGETLEAVRRILAQRRAISYTPIEWGFREEPGEEVEVQGPDNQIHHFLSYQALFREILRGKIKRSDRIRSVGEDLVDRSKAFPKELWETVEQFSSINTKFESLYRPLWSHLTIGIWIGAEALFLLLCTPPFLVLQTSIENSGSPLEQRPLIFFDLFIYLNIIGWIISSVKKQITHIATPKYDHFGLRTEWIFGSVIYVGCAVFYYIEFQGFSEFLSDTTGLIYSFLGSLFFSLFLGIPLGALIGTIIGHVRSLTLSPAPDAEPEGLQPYVIGLGYSSLMLLIAIPATWWLYPLFLESLVQF